VTSNTCWDWYLSKAYMIIAAQSIVARFLATFEEFPPAAEGGELHDRPGAREDAGCDERGAGLMSLKSWNDTRTTQAIVRIRRERSTKRRARGAGRGLRQRRHALAEKPMPIELGFILQRLTDMAEKDESLREQQPWKAAYEEDYAWLGGVIDKHYAGDDSDVKVLMGGILQAFAGQTVEEYMSAAATFLDAAAHPTLGRRLRDCGYVPMVELLRYLEGHGVTCFIASGGNRDFMRAVREIQSVPGSEERHLLRRSRRDAKRMVEALKARELAVPPFLLGGRGASAPRRARTRHGLAREPGLGDRARSRRHADRARRVVGDPSLRRPRLAPDPAGDDRPHADLLDDDRLVRQAAEGLDANVRDRLHHLDHRRLDPRTDPRRDRARDLSRSRLVFR
jgi:hypothetical protein